MGRGSKPAKGKARPAVTRKSQQHQDAKVRELEKRLAEALGKLQTRDREVVEAQEQQTATGEILRMISRSPTELQPVLAAVTESASRVCGADDAMIRLVDGDALRLVTHYGPLPDLDEIIPRNRGSATGRAIADRRAIHIHDLAAESEGEFPVGRSLQRRFHHRTVLARYASSTAPQFDRGGLLRWHAAVHGSQDAAPVCRATGGTSFVTSLQKH